MVTRSTVMPAISLTAYFTFSVMLAAIALTNTPAIVEGATNGVSGATNAMQQTATATTGAMQQTVAAVPGAFQIKPFRPPTDDEADPASPEHEEYEKLKKVLLNIYCGIYVYNLYT